MLGGFPADEMYHQLSNLDISRHHIWTADERLWLTLVRSVWDSCTSVALCCLCKWYRGVMGNKNSSASEMAAEEEISSLVHTVANQS